MQIHQFHLYSNPVNNVRMLHKLPILRILFLILVLVVVLYPHLTNAEQRIPNSEDQRWQISDSGSITWPISRNLSHCDHIEIRGKRKLAILRFSVLANSSFTACLIFLSLFLLLIALIRFFWAAL